jgi:hypothetical protein
VGFTGVAIAAAITAAHGFEDGIAGLRQRFTAPAAVGSTAVGVRLEVAELIG